MNPKAAGTEIGHRIGRQRQKVSHPLIQDKVLTPAGIDVISCLSQHIRHLVRIEAGGIHNHAGRNPLCAKVRLPAVLQALKPPELMEKQEIGPVLCGILRQTPHIAEGIQDCGGCRKHGKLSFHGGGMLLNLLLPDHGKPRHAVGLPLGEKTQETFSVILIESHNQLSRPLKGHIQLLGQLIKAPVSLHAELRHQRPRLIVVSGVQHRGIPGAGSAEEVIVPLRDTDPESIPRKLSGDGTAHSAGADHQNIVIIVHLFLSSVFPLTDSSLYLQAGSAFPSPTSGLVQPSILHLPAWSDLPFSLSREDSAQLPASTWKKMYLPCSLDNASALIHLTTPAQYCTGCICETIHLLLRAFSLPLRVIMTNLQLSIPASRFPSCKRQSFILNTSENTSHQAITPLPGMYPTRHPQKPHPIRKPRLRQGCILARSKGVHTL